MKKVLVTASTFPRWKDDTEPRFILDLCQALSKYVDVTVLVPAAIGAADEETMGNVHIIRYHYFPFHSLETLCYPGAIIPRIREKKIRILLVPFLIAALFLNLYKMRKDYDLVHAHWFIPQGIVQSLFNTPYIVTGHGGDVTSNNSFLIRKWKTACAQKAVHVTAVSSYLKEEILSWSKTVDIDIIPMGCQLELFSPENRVKNYFGQGTKKIVLFVGRLAEKKGVTYLIEAMKCIDAKLVIAGDGPLAPSLKRQALDQGEKIVFLGSCTHDELKTVYASADVFVAPSVTAQDGDREGFGLVMLEAMASGVPVVAFNSGGVSQLIKHGYNGLLCKEKDTLGLSHSIYTVLNDGKLRNNLAKNGIETSRLYDYSKIAKQYWEIYTKAYSSNNNSRI